MENFDYCAPTRYLFGQGISSRTGKIVREYGFKKVLLVSGRGSAYASGLIDSVKEQLDREHIQFCELKGVKPNPEAALVYEGIKLAVSEKVDFVLAVGGGSVIDTAKAVAIGAKDPDTDFFDFFLKKKTPNDALKVGCVLTIPAAGSEGSKSCVVQNNVDGKVLKLGLSTQLNVPLFAVLDPELTYSVNSYQTACGITDMIAHILERYFTNSKAVSVTDNLCEGLLKSIIENSATAINDPTNYDARANLMWASTLAHNNLLGVDREQDWSSHHLEHQLSALYDIAHGAGLAVIFPAWMEYVYKHDVMRFARFAVNVFSIRMNFHDPAATARDGIAAFRRFLHSIGMPMSFSEIGAKVEDIPLLLKMLDVDDISKYEGHFMNLYLRDCERIYELAANFYDERF